MIAPLLPPQLHVFVRDWLSANNVAAEEPRRTRADRLRLRPARAAHAGAARVGARHRRRAARVDRQHALPFRSHRRQRRDSSRRYGCPIAVPEGEAPLVERWDSKALLSTTATSGPSALPSIGCSSPARRTSGAISSGSALAAPGHDMGALVLLQRGARDPDLRRRAVGARLRLRDAARGRSRCAAGDARDGRDARGARRARRHSRPRRALHRRRSSARTRAAAASPPSRRIRCGSRGTRSR